MGTNLTNSRDKSIDIAKGICILLMVLCHSFVSRPYIGHAIYMFHMPCFFIIAGYLLRDKYLSDYKKGILSKLKGAYLPYVKWMTIFFILHNLLFNCHLYENAYSGTRIIKKIGRVFLLQEYDLLLGGYWFLIALTIGSIMAFSYLFTLNRHKKLTNVNIMGGVIFCLILASVISRSTIGINTIFKAPSFIAAAFFLTGYAYKNLRIHIDQPLKPGLLLLMPAFIFALFFEWEIPHIEGLEVMLYFVPAISGSIAVLLISNFIANFNIGSFIAYIIGNKSLYILTFHLISFKLVSFGYLKIKGLPIERLTEFPVLQDDTPYLWSLYFLAGVIIPLILWEVSTRIKRYLKEINHYFIANTRN